ncbi:MAG: T9SS type A sorting domain-containing protein [Bacteroidales bacterium]|nr:T9SS type A sorting domain-containing protein [Bacteroidales bacterium]
MKKCLLHILILFCFIYTKAQTGLFVNSKVFVSDNTILFVNGDFQNNFQGSQFYNSGTINIKGNLIHTGSEMLFQDSYELGRGKIFFSGETVQRINSENNIGVADLEINKSSYLLLQSDVYINNNLTLTSGVIKIAYNNIYLQKFTNLGVTRFGTIISERENNNITGKTGMINAQDVFLAPGNTNMGGTGLKIYCPIFVPSLSISRGHAIQPAGKNSIARFYQIDQGNTGFEASQLRLYYLDNDFEDIPVEETNLRIFYSPPDINTYTMLSSIQNSYNYCYSNSADIDLGKYVIADKNCDINPEIIFSGDTILCIGENLSLSANPNYFTENRYFWTCEQLGIINYNSREIFIEGTLFPTPGNYSFFIKAINPRGCETLDTITVRINPYPQISFSFNKPSFCQQETIEFSATPGMDNYFWNLGNEVQSTLQSFNYSYPNEGNYLITLNADSAGCSSSFSQYLPVFPLPNVSFSYLGECVEAPIDFQNLTTFASSFSFPYIYSTVWHYGDSQIDSFAGFNASIQHYYSSPGLKNVKLIIKTSQNCTDSAMQIITIKPNFEAEFSFLNACNNNPVVFIDNSPSVEFANYTINYGDGISDSNISNNISTSHIYPNVGLYYPEIIYHAPNYCNDTLNTTVEIYPTPNPGFIVENFCLGDETHLSTTSAEPDDSIFWDFGNGITYYGIDTVIAYNESGNYIINQIITNSYNCIDSFSAEITIYPIPYPEINSEGHCAEYPVNFVSNSVGNTYLWTIEGIAEFDSLYDNSEISYIFPLSGNFEVQLTEINEFGCNNYANTNLEIFDNPEITLNDTSSTCALYCILNGGSEYNFYLWSNGMTGNIISVSTPGNYSVLSTNPETGCFSSKETTVILDSELSVNLGEDVSVCDSTILNAGYYQTWQWNTDEQLQSILVLESGVYSVTVSDFAGCEATDEVNIIVNFTPFVSILGDSTECEGNNADIFAYSNGENFLWNTGDTSQAISISNTGSYSVTVTGDGGCSAISENFDFTLLPKPYVFLGNDTTACNNILLDANNSGCNYLWSNGWNEQILEVVEAGLYSVTVISEDYCISIDSIEIGMKYMEEVNLGSDIAVCYGTEVIISPQNIALDYSHSWNTGAIGDSLEIEISGTYIITRNGLNGCIDNDTIVVEFYNLPDFQVFDVYICSETGVLVELTEYQNVNWYNNSEIISENNSAYFFSPGKYFVSVTNEFGCEKTDSFMVNPYPFSIYPHFLVASQAKVGDTLHFISLVDPEPDFYNWTFQDGASSSVQDPLHTFYIEGSYNVQMLVGLGQCSATFNKQIEINGFNKYYLQEFPNQEYTPSHFIDFASVKLFPNPCHFNFYLNISLTAPSPILIECFNITGQRIFSQKLPAAEVFTLAQNTSNFISGVYIIKISTPNTSRTQKLIIGK